MFYGAVEFPHAEQLDNVARLGVPVAVAPGVNFEKELECENHASREPFGEEVLK